MSIGLEHKIEISCTGCGCTLDGEVKHVISPTSSQAMTTKIKIAPCDKCMELTLDEAKRLINSKHQALEQLDDEDAADDSAEAYAYNHQ